MTGKTPLTHELLAETISILGTTVPGWESLREKLASAADEQSESEELDQITQLLGQMQIDSEGASSSYAKLEQPLKAARLEIAEFERLVDVGTQIAGRLRGISHDWNVRRVFLDFAMAFERSQSKRALHILRHGAGLLPPDSPPPKDEPVAVLRIQVLVDILTTLDSARMELSADGQPSGTLKTPCFKELVEEFRATLSEKPVQQARVRRFVEHAPDIARRTASVERNLVDLKASSQGLRKKLEGVESGRFLDKLVKAEEYAGETVLRNAQEELGGDTSTRPLRKATYDSLSRRAKVLFSKPPVPEDEFQRFLDEAIQFARAIAKLDVRWRDDLTPYGSGALEKAYDDLVDLVVKRLDIQVINAITKYTEKCLVAMQAYRSGQSGTIQISKEGRKAHG